jgi:ornithine cyclodeaminase
MKPRILHAHEIAPHLSFERLIPALAQAFRDHFGRRAKIAPITNIGLPDVNGEMHIKPGYFSDGDHVCVKIATCYYDNPSKGLPTRDGVVVVANRTSGRIEAVLCDAGLITDVRTAGSSAVAVDALARPGAITLGIVGAGTQAYWHASALRHVRPIDRVLLWGRRRAQVDAAIDRVATATELPVEAGTIDEVMTCDVVVTATPATAPVLTEPKLRPGAVVIAMGSDAAGKRELGPHILQQASLIVADSLDQCRAIGELQWLSKAKQRVAELGAILSGAQPGRQTPDDIIIFDSTGMGFQDVVGASEVLIAQPAR